MTVLPRRAPTDVRTAAGDAIDPATLATAAQILADVDRDGDAAVRRHAERFDELHQDRLTLGPDVLAAAFEQLPATDQQMLRDVAGRIRSFAEAQRDSISEFSRELPGGIVAQKLAPVERAGCYAPGGLATLPSSLLMTAVTARAAGVPVVLAASPRPTPIVLAAAHVASCDALLACGGAQAIAALAYGDQARPGVDVVVGPGNRFVTAAKQLVQGRVGIDLPAGPSELCVVADDHADPELVAADLLAQAEHDPTARPWLVTTSSSLPDQVERALTEQLATLPTAAVAKQALQGGGCVCCRDEDELLAVVDRLAPEHLQLACRDGDRLAPRFAHYGALFFGAHGAEVLGDYGAGPNHVLPTGGAARYTGGLSVFQFLRVRTWLRLDRPPAALLRDAARLADLEGLPGHAAAARRRLAR
ncbi:MAG: histidinol dehydrogenase [Planctomycetota bacterium]